MAESNNNNERVVGEYQGQVKWFDNKLGYGFITVLTGEHSGSDIFVHQTNVFPLTSEYRTLSKGEYVALNLSDDDKRQALNVTGICGGSLRCDEPRPSRRRGGGAGNTSSSGNDESSESA